jgi:L-rhamnose 1-dehydrogenase
MSSITFPLLKGKTAIITGGTTGIGRGIALEFLRQGCNVAVNHLGLSRDESHKNSLLEEAQEIREKSKQLGNGLLAGEMVDFAGDITEPTTTEKLVEETVKRFGQLDVLVANAGIFEPANFLE